MVQSTVLALISYHQQHSCCYRWQMLTYYSFLSMVSANLYGSLHSNSANFWEICLSIFVIFHHLQLRSSLLISISPAIVNSTYPLVNCLNSQTSLTCPNLTLLPAYAFSIRQSFSPGSYSSSVTLQSASLCQLLSTSSCSAQPAKYYHCHLSLDFFSCPFPG